MFTGIAAVYLRWHDEIKQDNLKDQNAEQKKQSRRVKQESDITADIVHQKCAKCSKFHCGRRDAQLSPALFHFRCLFLSYACLTTFSFCVLNNCLSRSSRGLKCLSFWPPEPLIPVLKKLFVLKIYKKNNSGLFQALYA